MRLWQNENQLLSAFFETVWQSASCADLQLTFNCVSRLSLTSTGRKPMGLRLSTETLREPQLVSSLTNSSAQKIGIDRAASLAVTLSYLANLLSCRYPVRVSQPTQRRDTAFSHARRKRRCISRDQGDFFVLQGRLVSMWTPRERQLSRSPPAGHPLLHFFAAIALPSPDIPLLRTRVPPPFRSQHIPTAACFQLL